MVMDTVCSRVFGPHQARDVRVVWAEGRLYIVASPSDIRVFDVPQQPRKTAGTWKVMLTDGTALRLQPATCGTCRRRVMASPAGQMTVDEIVAAGVAA